MAANPYRTHDWVAIYRRDFPKFALDPALVVDVPVSAATGGSSYNDFDPKGGLWHYTAAPAGRTAAQSENMCGALLRQLDYSQMVPRSGRIFVGRTGGQCWHAGLGNTAAAAKACAGQITRTDLTASPQTTNSGGNRMLVGLCVDTSGSEPITGLMRRVMHVVSAIIVFHSGWAGVGRADGHWLHHRSYTNRKFDLMDRYPDRRTYQSFDEGWLADHVATIAEARRIYSPTTPKPPGVPVSTRPAPSPAVWSHRFTNGTIISVDQYGQVVDRSGARWNDLWEQKAADGVAVAARLGANTIFGGQVMSDTHIILYAKDATLGGGVFNVLKK